MRARTLAIALLWGLWTLPPPAAAEAEVVELGFGHARDLYETNTRFLVLDEALNERVTAIGERVALASGGSFDYRFRIVNSPTANAFATAGGYVYVTTGLIDLVATADELAGALAHEIAHNNQSHLTGRIRSAERAEAAIAVASLVLAAGLGAAGAYAGAGPGNIASLLQFGFMTGGLVGNVTADVILRGYAEGDEIEADEMAVSMMVAAGYDPYALIRLFGKFKGLRDTALAGGTEYRSALVNKQPGLEERMDHLNELIREAR